ncbi:hypothetical protein ACFYVL_16480 [Streptomyces sp. NPDC004111]|uniref:hypothetical protein n=1 Tax=Streptomyces sp. NPDC004111 TaxID=3364690 RepID=UPI0036B89A4C
MTSKEYRERAEQLLTGRHPHDLPDRYIRQAAVWAQLATAAAIEETTQPAIAVPGTTTGSEIAA